MGHRIDGTHSSRGSEKKERECVEIETPHLRLSELSKDHLFILAISKGAGRILKQTFVDTYKQSRPLQSLKTPITSRRHFEWHEVCVILSGNGLTYASHLNGSGTELVVAWLEQYNYQLILAINDIGSHPRIDYYTAYFSFISSSISLKPKKNKALNSVKLSGLFFNLRAGRRTLLSHGISHHLPNRRDWRLFHSLSSGMGFQVVNRL